MLTFNPEPFEIWPAIFMWVIVVFAFSVVAVVFAMAVGLLTGGLSGAGRVLKGLVQGIVDLFSISPGRVYAISQLTFREALRRKALLVFVVFAVLFMFAGWFLQGANQRPDEQVKVLVSFVLTTLSFLILPVALLLACWGIPEDIRRRSLHTIVTKPVRRSEVVIGRILGYVAINTVVLLVMGLVGYVWVLRQVPSESRSALVSRVPIFGELEFLNKQGEVTSQGVNVGDIWQHRSYIEGNTPERAVYVFDDVTPDAMTDVLVQSENQEDREEQYLRLESTFEAFRTYKGDMSRGISVQYTYANPDDPTKRYVDPNIFDIQEFQLNVQDVPRKLRVDDPEEYDADELDVIETEVNGEKVKQYYVDLFDDFAPEGRLRVEVAALDGGQYLGMAPADLFIRTPDRPFASGYFKAVIGIWLMIVLVVLLGVTASTFLKGPVATLLTFVLFVIGSPFRGFMDSLATSYQASVTTSGARLEGGGPLESIYRIVSHMNPSTELPAGTLTSVINAVDHVFLSGIWLVRYLIPDFGVFNLSRYVSEGFDVGWSTGLLPAIAVTLAFILPCILIGYYSLRFRELEAK